MTPALFQIASYWPFANGWMLLWALAAAIPIILHLWNRRQYQLVPWAAMEYLLAAIQKTSRRLTIKQLMLLAVRVLILLLLALALADPNFSFLPSLANNLGTGGQTHWVLVIDGSYSMDYRSDDKSCFDEAKQRASTIVERATQGDGFTLVLMSDPPRVIVHQPTFSRDDVLEEIDKLRLPHGGGNLLATLAEVANILKVSAEKHPRLKYHTVVLLTDMGRTTWDEVESKSCRDRIQQLAGRASLFLYDLGIAERQNLAVSRLSTQESLVTLQSDVTIQAEIENLGSHVHSRARVELIVDSQSVQEESIDLGAYGRATTSFAHRFGSPGEHVVEVRLAGDALIVDNHRWISVPVRESIQVLCVHGKPGSADYVALALQPSKSNRPRVRTATVTENALVEMDLDEFDCVFLCNVGRFGRDEASVLSDYLKNGGGLVFFLGDQVQPDSYNGHLGGELSGRRILPARLERIVDEGQYHFDPLDYRHPIVAPFRGHEQAGLLTTPVWRYFKLKPYDPTSAKTALAFDSRDPAIVEEKILRGRTVIYASAASDLSPDRPWTLIHAWASFPPLVQEMLALAVRGRTLSRNVLVGDALEGVIHGVVTDISLPVTQPDGRSDRASMTIDGADTRWMFAETQQSGIYEVRLETPGSQTQLFAVNVDTRESSMERYDPELLPSELTHETRVDAVQTRALPESSGDYLFQYVLLALLLLLFAESFLAWSFGRERGFN